MTAAQARPASLRASTGHSEGVSSAPQLVYRRDPKTGEPVEGYLTWGLIPHYAERRPEVRPIHARAESLTYLPMFRDAYRKRRCIAPMTSFFQKDRAQKRYAVARADGQPFGVAAIWENWRNPETEEWERSFALITVAANELIAPRHDRMLAILDPVDFPRWYSDEEDPRDLLKPYPAELLTITQSRAKARGR